MSCVNLLTCQPFFLTLLFFGSLTKYISFISTTRLILEELEGPAVSMLFCKSWELGGEYVGTMIATFQDYFQDMQVWLPDFFYSKFVRDVLHSVIGRYVITLCRFSGRCESTYTFASELKTAKRVLQDLNCIQQFFLLPEQLEMLRKGGLRGWYHDNIW